MDITTSEMVVRALRRIGVVAYDDPPTADQAQAGLDALNELAASLPANGVAHDMPWLGPATPLPIDRALYSAFQTVLAARLAEDYAVPGPNPLEAWAQMRAFYLCIPEMPMPLGLLRTPSQRRIGIAPCHQHSPVIPTPPQPSGPRLWVDASLWDDAFLWRA